MANKDLNIRIGIIYKGIDRPLRQVEQMLNRSAARFDAASNRMSLALTAPLVAFAAKSVNTAGDFDSLRRAMEVTMKSGGYSIAQANSELENLRKSALAPGLDLEQAVKGSVRLQGVGLSANFARKTLEELGNAIASTGGDAQNLDSVTKQFTQMIAKGRILQEDLTIIQENMPSITAAMQKAFGTSSAEALRNMGINSQQFIEGIVGALSELPRVEGGIKNTLVNAGSAVRQFFGGIGEELYKVLEMDKRTGQLSGALEQAARYFRTLDAETKKQIVTWGLYLAAAGPVLKVTSALYSGGALLISGFRTGLAATKDFSNAVSALSGAFAKLNTITKASVIGLTLTAAVGLYAAFDRINSSVRNLNPLYSQMVALEKQATAEITSQKVNTGLLIETLKSETSSRKDKIAALNTLKSISPEYFGQLSVEKSSVNQLNQAYQGYVDQILRAARAKKAAEKLVELDEQQTGALERRNKLIQYYNSQLSQTAEVQAYNNALTQAGRDEVEKSFSLKRQEFSQRINQIDAELTAIKQQDQAFRDLYSVNAAVVESEKQRGNFNSKISANMADQAKSAEKIKDEFDKYLDAAQKAEDAKKKAAEVAEKMGLSPLDSLPTSAPTQPKALIDQTKVSQQTYLMWEYAASIKATTQEAITPMQAAFEALSEKTLNFNEVFTLMSETVQEQGLQNLGVMNGLQFAALSAANAMQVAASQGASSFKTLALAALSAASDVVRGQIMQGVSAHVAKTLASAPPFVGLALGAAAGAGAAALFNGILKKIKAPKLAKGGLALGPTAAIVGDNRAASVDPEVIAPLSKLKKYMKPENQNSVMVYGRIQGRDIYISNAKESMLRGRVTGAK